MKRALLLILLFILTCFALNATEKVVILGSGPAGLTAAIYTARADLNPLVIEGEEPGGQIALSHQVDNFPGFPEGVNGYELGEMMREQALRFNTRIKQGQVVSVNLQHRPFTLTLDDGKVLKTESLIIASGASTKWLGLPSEKALIGQGVSSCAVCDAFFYKDKKVVVVGGGDTAMEDALYLSQYASKVTVIHRRDSLRASKYLINKSNANPLIEFVWDSVVEEVKDPEQDEVTAVVIRNVKTDERREIPCEGVFIAIGHAPNTTPFKGQIALDEEGYIVTQEKNTCTSVPGVFAAGDVADNHYRQAITAAASGCMAGIDVYHYLQSKKEE